MEAAGEPGTPAAIRTHGDTGVKASFPVLGHRRRGAHGHPHQPPGSSVPADENPSGYGGAENIPDMWTVRGFLLVPIAIFLELDDDTTASLPAEIMTERRST